MSAGAPIEKYTPKNIPAQSWETIRSFCIENGKKYQVDRPQEVRKFMGHLSALAYWTHIQNGYELIPEQIFDAEVINQFIATGSTELSRGSLSTRKTTLIRVGEVCNPCWNGVANYRKGQRSTPSAPYTAKEIQSIYDWCTTPNQFVTAERKKLVALGFGAGLAPAEACLVKWRDIETDELGTLIHVATRVVPMRSSNAETLEELRGNDDDYVLRPRVKDRSTDGVALKTLRGYDNGNLRPNQRRLRVTWIVNLMNNYIPDAAICAAAGLQDLRNFKKYHPPVDVNTALRIRSQLHHVGETMSGWGALRVVQDH